MIAFLLLGRLVVGNTTEIGIPFLKSMWARTRKDDKPEASVEDAEAKRGTQRQWVHDASADPLEHDGVAEEYMEMMVRTGKPVLTQAICCKA